MQQNRLDLPDDWSPGELAARIESAGVAKARLTPIQTLALSILAGAFIGFGGAVQTVAITGLEPGFGPARILGGFVFSLGLILVIVAGAELFTGNALMIVAAVDRRVTWTELARNWAIVYLGNALGAVGLAVLIWQSGILGGPMGATAVRTAEVKSALGYGEVAVRGVLCNVLVCLAVWIAAAARHTGGRILAIVFPVTAFVALGFEHSVANMYLLPQGAFAGADVTIGGILANIFFASLGNVLGGVGGVGLAYRLIWGPPQSPAG